MKQEWNKLNLSENTHQRLLHISKITNIPMSRIIEQITESLFGLTCNYDYATFAVDYSLLEGMCHITLRGYKKIQVSHFKLVSEKSDAEVDELIKADMLKHVEKENKEIFGED